MTFTRINNRDLWIPFLSEVLKLVLNLREAGSLDDFVSFDGPVPNFKNHPSQESSIT